MSQPQFQVHKIYIKDLSFEIPHGVESFRSSWAPELNVELQSITKPLAEANTHEVVLSVKCTVSCDNKVAFVVEAKQAGIFTIDGTDEAEVRKTLGSFCPAMLYPYLRETISHTVMQGGFPQLSLHPINFDLMYQQQLAQEQAQAVKQ